MKSEQEPKWSGDIAPSLEALCWRLSKEAERTFDRDGELSVMLFLVEAPGRGQGKVCAPVFSDGVFKTLRRDFAKWGVTRYAFAAESWVRSENGEKKGLRPSEDPERREIVCVGATDGRSGIAGMRDIHRPQYGKPSLGKLELGPEKTQGLEIRGRLFALLHPRPSSELPDDEGTVFVTNVPGSSIQVLGRRDPTTGELCVYATIRAQRDFDEACREPARRGVEIVTGPEAEDLIRRIQLTTVNLH
jgi:hypothetical protein